MSLFITRLCGSMMPHNRNRNMKYSERKIRQNKSGKKRINMHENTYDTREISLCIRAQTAQMN
jgi:hypothetical protein